MRRGIEKYTVKPNFLSSIGAAIGPISGAIGSIIGGGISRDAQRDTNTSNEQSAREQMAFQERMSNTAHQRQVKDLKEAGLNPLLATNTGASSPQGAKAEFGNPGAAFVQGFTSTLNAAADLGFKMEQIELMDAQKDMVAAQTKSETKHHPGADIKNRIYKLMGPALKNFEKWVDDGVKSKPGNLHPKSMMVPRGGLR